MAGPEAFPYKVSQLHSRSATLWQGYPIAHNGKRLAVCQLFKATEVPDLRISLQLLPQIVHLMVGIDELAACQCKEWLRSWMMNGNTTDIELLGLIRSDG